MPVPKSHEAKKREKNRRKKGEVEEEGVIEGYALYWA